MRIQTVSLRLITAMVAFAAITAAGGVARAQTTQPAGPKTVAILGVRATDALEKSFTDPKKRNSMARVREAIDPLLTDRLTNTRKFKIIARADLDKVLKEQALGDSGNCNPSDPKVAKSFLLAGAEYGLVFELLHFQDVTSRIEISSVARVTRRVSFSAVGKLYNTTTGQVEESISIPVTELAPSVSDVRTNVKSEADGDVTDAMLVESARAIAEIMANRAIDVMFPAKVVARTGKQITINRGDGTAIFPGQPWRVFTAGKPLIDPDTNEVIGREEVAKGRVKIVSVMPKASTAEVVDDEGIDVGMILRPEVQAPSPAAQPAPLP